MGIQCIVSSTVSGSIQCDQIGDIRLFGQLLKKVQNAGPKSATIWQIFITFCHNSLARFVEEAKKHINKATLGNKVVFWGENFSNFGDFFLN